MYFSCKSVVITGASSGIGAELARQLAAPGVSLVLAGRNVERLQAVESECTQRGAQAMSVRCDVAVESDCRMLMQQAVERFGGIDILVNNAGVSGHAFFDDVSDFAWYEQMMKVNYFGSLWCTRHALPHLKARRGQIVAVSSLAGRTGIPARTGYCATKFAMSGFFEALRIELRGTGVDVTLVYPGVVATEIRRSGYNAEGKAAGVSGLKEEGAMSVEECARQIVSAIAGRKRELVMTAIAKVGLWVKLFAPGLIDRVAAARLKKML